MVTDAATSTQLASASYTTMKDIIFTSFIFGMFLPTTYSRQVQFYRKDYTYIEEFDAFYKFDWDVSGSAWSTALFTCDDEGATLFYPKAEDEWTVVRNLTDKVNKDGDHNVTDIFVGLHDEFELGEFMTVDGYPTPASLSSDSTLLPEPHRENCMTMNIDSGSFKVSSCLRTPYTAGLPFVCKKVDNESCPTIDRGYKYMKESKKCYKVNEKSLKWEKAMKTCFLEGGILAVIEDSAQALAVQSMLGNESPYFVGVRQLNSRDDFYSVKGQKFSDMYQRQYDISSPPFDCGTVKKYDGRLYTQTLSCDDEASFVCEMDLHRVAV